MVSPRVPLPQGGTICVEGNIGCGKTTFLNYFLKRFMKAGEHSSSVTSEPVEEWRNVCGENLFQYLYKDPSRWSLAFQTYVQLTMIQLHEKQPRLMERSIYSARYCFVQNLYKLNYLSTIEYNILDKWFNYLVTDILVDDGDKDVSKNILSHPSKVNIDMIIYLRCKPQKLMERIRKRSREEEKDISFDYINNLHQLHEDWLIDRKFPVPAPVLVLDVDCEPGSLEKLYEKAEPYIWGEKKLNNPQLILSAHCESINSKKYTYGV